MACQGIKDSVVCVECDQVVGNSLSHSLDQFTRECVVLNICRCTATTQVGASELYPPVKVESEK